MNLVETALLWSGVLVCGGVGAVLRFLVDGAVTRRVISRFPVGTLVVNLSGAFALGFFDGLVLSNHAALVVGTGLIGSYTTFSTWMFESQRLGEEQQARRALANIIVSLAAGLGFATLGLQIGAQL